MRKEEITKEDKCKEEGETRQKASMIETLEKEREEEAATKKSSVS